jgi:uncharacterized protein (TIGR03086 family)
MDDSHDHFLRSHSNALAGFDALVRSITEEQWDAPTPDTEWDVSALVDHLVVEQLWVPPLLAGETVAQVGDRFDRTLVGPALVAAWDEASKAAAAAFAADGALDREVHLSYGDTSALSYGWEMTADLVVHGWDLAQGLGAPYEVDEAVAQEVWDRLSPMADMLAASGMFAPPVPVPDDAPVFDRLLGLSGRQP